MGQDAQRGQGAKMDRGTLGALKGDTALKGGAALKGAGGGYGEHWGRAKQWAGAQMESRGQHSNRNSFQKSIKEALGAVTGRQGQQLRPEKLSRSRGGMLCLVDLV